MPAFSALSCRNPSLVQQLRDALIAHPFCPQLADQRDDRLGLDELERRVDELAAMLAELLREGRAGIRGPKEFTKQGVEDWFEERIRPVGRSRWAKLHQRGPPTW